MPAPDYEVTIVARFRWPPPDEETVRELVEDELDGELVTYEEEEV